MKYNGKEYYSQGDVYAAILEENRDLNERIRFLEQCLDNKEKVNKSLREEIRKLSEGKIIYASEKEQRHYVDILEGNKKLKDERDMLVLQQMGAVDHLDLLEKDNKKLKERIDILYEFIERNDKLVDEVIDEEDLDKLNRYIYIDDDLVDRALESED